MSWSFNETGIDQMRPTSSRDPSAQIKRLHFGQPARGCLSMVGCGDSRTRRWSKHAQFGTCGMPHDLDWHLETAWNAWMIKIILFFRHSAGLTKDGRAGKPYVEQTIRLRFERNNKPNRNDEWLRQGDQSQFWFTFNRFKRTVSIRSDSISSGRVGHHTDSRPAAMTTRWVCRVHLWSWWRLWTDCPRLYLFRTRAMMLSRSNQAIVRLSYRFAAARVGRPRPERPSVSPKATSQPLHHRLLEVGRWVSVFCGRVCFVELYQALNWTGEGEVIEIVDSSVDMFYPMFYDLESPRAFSGCHRKIVAYETVVDDSDIGERR
jgi:hypothetical protein